MNRKLLIAIEPFSSIDNAVRDRFGALGVEIVQNPRGKELDYRQDGDWYRDAAYVIAGLESYDARFFSGFPNVRVISRVGVGVDAIDMRAASGAGVAVYRTSDAPSVAVSELCVANMISLLRKTIAMSNSLKADHWRPLQGRELRSCTVGIIGLGSIGKEVVKRLRGFGCSIVGYGRTWDAEFAAINGVRRMSLADVMRTSDIVTIHLPLTDETRGLINSEHLSAMKDNAIVINTSRFGVIDNEWLAKELASGRLAGAAIDVFDESRNPGPYKSLENVILTPHIGSHTRETRAMMESMALDNVMNHRLIEIAAGDRAVQALAVLKRFTVSP